MEKSEEQQLAQLMERLESGELVNQPCWSFVKEMNSFSEERLNSVALRDGYRTYSYRQMFRNWERYAEAFTGVGLTRDNGSRVALIGTPTVEVIFAFYGLNMTGASVSHIYPLDLFDEKQIQSMIEREGITDLMVSEVWAFPQLMQRLMEEREDLGLRNIILLESPMGGEFAIPWLELFRKTNATLFRELDDGLMMEDLLKDYEATPISYGGDESYDSSVILHTTGTVNGMHKPVPMSDKALNSFAPAAIKAKDTYDDFKDLPDHLVSCLTLNMSWVYSMVDMLHMPLCLGMEIVCLPWGGTNPRYGEAIEYYGFNLLFTSMSILDSWLKSMPEMDLSALKVVFMGGTYVPPDYKEKFNDYLARCGSTARVINGYGLSELGGACIISPSDRTDDAIGYPLPGYKVKIYVEEDDRYYDLSDGPRTGILLLSSGTLSTGKLDDTVFFELVNIDGDDYFDTNDLVRVNEDGSMTCIGRSNQFFVNNAGVRFDAGLVQTAITSQPGIVACGLAPEFHKTLHDNIPVLYVEVDKERPDDLIVVRDALIEVFVEGDMLEDTNMPSQCVLVERIPLNSGGKVDVKRLTAGNVTGKRFSIKPVKVAGEVVDIMLVPAAEGENALMGAGIPEELENDPYNILSELFAIIPDINKGDYGKIFRIPGFRELCKKLTGFDIHNISGSVLSMTPKMVSIVFRKYIMPIMKGEKAMSEKKNDKAAAPMLPGMPPMPMPMPFPWDMEGEWNFGLSKSDLKSNWEKSIDRQKSYLDGSKDQYDRFFENMSEMLDSFAESLPEELPWMPSWAKAPKSVRKEMKEWENMANEYFKEMADTWNNFVFEAQEKACDQIPEDAKDSGKKGEVIDAKAEAVEKPAKATKSTAAKSTATKTTAAKSTATKTAAPAKQAAPATAAKDAK